MSNHPHHQRRKPTSGPERLAALVLASARLEGCTCTPSIRVPRKGLRRGHLAFADVYHDSWCALARRAGAAEN